jgi:hypothetical protein
VEKKRAEALMSVIKKSDATVEVEVITNQLDGCEQEACNSIILLHASPRQGECRSYAGVNQNIWIVLYSAEPEFCKQIGQGEKHLPLGHVVPTDGNLSARIKNGIVAFVRAIKEGKCADPAHLKGLLNGTSGEAAEKERQRTQERLDELYNLLGQGAPEPETICKRNQLLPHE